VPFLHFFDGFRTSHEINKIHMLNEDDPGRLSMTDWVLAHRARALNPDAPVMRGTAQNPDTYFQAREASTPSTRPCRHRAAQAWTNWLLTGRHYHLVDYHGHPKPSPSSSC
jgi:pyruvate-ferredoxin/flavodoxin oxidoreductase